MMKKTALLILLVFCFHPVWADNNVFVYLLKYTKSNGEAVVVYCGITNNPETRAIEHVTDGTMRYNTFDTMVVVAGPMAREQALQKETECIYRYPIPRLYQTYPNDPDRPSSLGQVEKDREIARYESRFDASHLVQTPNPRVEYAPEVRRRLVCEDCGRRVTDRVLVFSHKNFDGHVFCLGCQSRHRDSSDSNDSSSESDSESEHEYRHLRVCEECGEDVTTAVFYFSRRYFCGHVFCRYCQSKYR